MSDYVIKLQRAVDRIAGLEARVAEIESELRRNPPPLQPGHPWPFKEEPEKEREPSPGKRLQPYPSREPFEPSPYPRYPTTEPTYPYTTTPPNTWKVVWGEPFVVTCGQV